MVTEPFEKRKFTVKRFLYRYRLVWFWSYFALLTRELLISNPWVILGDRIAANPPLDTSSDPASAFLHGSTFAVLSLLACFAFQQKSEKTQIRYSLWLVAYCGLTECLQVFVPNRFPSGEDVLFNVMGLIMGVVFYFFTQRHWNVSAPLLTHQPALESIS